MCVAIKLQKAIKSLDKGKELKTSLDSTTIKANKILKKTELIELSKKSLEAQFANSNWNEFNKRLSTLVNINISSGKWEGSWAMRKNHGTDNTQALQNRGLAESIITNPQISALYGRFEVPGHGIVELNEKTASKFIAAKLAHMRKPSSYEKKYNSSKATNEKADSDEEGSSVNDDTSRAPLKHRSNKSNKEGEGVKARKHAKTSEGPENEKLEVAKTKDQEEETEEEEDLEIPKDKAMLVGLFYIGLKRKEDAQMAVLKRHLSKLKIAATKNTEKITALQMIGKEVFNSKKVVRVDQERPIAFSNLRRTTKDD
ncbi:uncharacterized protein LOC116607156 [Nematostella vectensis]|uniref:uncharacterized protein LOC116607156 n=1 Tax=Nematostella vectensis TaxID=45351 RepID=UPI00207760F8|nr:uncharacterized protein LOC116607156 [Nematostella vectensis]